MNVGTEIRYYNYESSAAQRERLRVLLAEQLGVSKESLPADLNLINSLGVKSLDMVELVMELEEEFDDNGDR